MLILVVKRGEGIIERRARERLPLKSSSAGAKHLSSSGEMTAGISHEIRNPLGINTEFGGVAEKENGRF